MNGKCKILSIEQITSPRSEDSFTYRVDEDVRNVHNLIDEYDYEYERLVSPHQNYKFLTSKSKTLDDGTLEMLVESVKKRPELWNIRNVDFKNRTIKPRIWEDVLREIDITNTSENMLMVKKKWDHLKTAYYRSKKGAPSGSAYTHKEYKYGRMLSFLDDTVAPRASTLLYNDEIDSDNLEKSTSNDSDILETKKTTISNKRKRNTDASNIELKKKSFEVLQNIQEDIRQHATPSHECCCKIDPVFKVMQRDFELLPDFAARRIRNKILKMIEKEIEKYQEHNH